MKISQTDSGRTANSSQFTRRAPIRVNFVAMRQRPALVGLVGALLHRQYLARKVERPANHDALGPVTLGLRSSDGGCNVSSDLSGKSETTGDGRQALWQMKCLMFARN